MSMKIQFLEHVIKLYVKKKISSGTFNIEILDLNRIDKICYGPIWGRRTLVLLVKVTYERGEHAAITLNTVVCGTVVFPLKGKGIVIFVSYFVCGNCYYFPISPVPVYSYYIYIIKWKTKYTTLSAVLILNRKVAETEAKSMP
jgi:hypothetical protein